DHFIEPRFCISEIFFISVLFEPFKPCLFSFYYWLPFFPVDVSNKKRIIKPFNRTVFKVSLRLINNTSADFLNYSMFICLYRKTNFLLLHIALPPARIAVSSATTNYLTLSTL